MLASKGQPSNLQVMSLASNQLRSKIRWWRRKQTQHESYQSGKDALKPAASTLETFGEIHIVLNASHR